MAIPLKNGADLYNFEVLRMRFQNLGADPASDFGVGQVYFNTSTSEGSGKRLRIYDGSAFRSLAYFDEIDNRLKLLEGEIDTDAIISNMKEVSAFLEGFAEDASLMDVLNGKLNKTGGTMSLASISSFMINRTDAGSPAIGFSSNGAYWGSIGFSSNGVPVFYDGAQVKYNFIHSGNVGEYALKKGAGGYRLDIDTPLASNEADFHAYFQRIGTGTDISSSDVGSARKGVIRLAGGGSESQLLFDHNAGNMYLRNYGSSSWSAWKTIAFTDSNVASATKLETARTIWGQSFDGTGDVSGSLYFGANTVSIYGYDSTDSSNVEALYLSSTYKQLQIGSGTSVKGYNTYIYGNKLHLRYGTSKADGLILNSSGNVTIGDSDLAGDRKLYVAGKSAFIGADSKEVQVTVGNTVNQVQLGVTDVGVAYMFTSGAYDMAFSTSGTRRMTITAGGNVIIGTTTDDGSGAKLQVNGYVALKGIRLYHQTRITSEVGNYLWQYYESGDLNLLALTSRNTEGAFKNWIITTNWDNGNVGIGTGDPKYKLDVNGDLHVTGNIIADGEVSAGGAGEEGDTGTGTGGGDALIYSQEFTPTTTSITITHNLSATKGVIVQVWEKNGNYWDMVLVDVEEVDTNTVTLFFVKTETTVHKVVIMG